MKKFENKIDLLNDTIDYFWGRPERQCVSGGSCQYAATETSEGCAIGRLLPPSYAATLPQNVGVINDKVFDLLPLWLQAFGQEFLSRLQDLHDGNFLVERNKENLYIKMHNHVDFGQIVFPNNENN